MSGILYSKMSGILFILLIVIVKIKWLDKLKGEYSWWIF